VDSLRRDDIDEEKATSPESRARLALEVMAIGIQLKREQLVRRFPLDSAAQIDTRLARR